MIIDEEKLKKDLIDYLYAGVFLVNGGILFEIDSIRKLTGEELVNKAIEYGIDINKYIVVSRVLKNE